MIAAWLIKINLDVNEIERNCLSASAVFVVCGFAVKSICILGLMPNH